MRYVVLGLLLAAAGCGSGTPPTAPTKLALTAPVATPPPTGPAATLELTTFTLGVPEFNNGWYFYYPQLELKETTGLGGAAVTSIAYAVPGGDGFIISGQGCSLPSNVSPGGTWQIGAVYYYCQDVDVRAPLDSLNVTITYTDTAGHSKTVSGVAR
jgi:hypothetical protein